MKKLLKRWVPLFMALALVVGAVNNNYLTVRATESDTQIGGGTADASEVDAVLPESEETAGQGEAASADADVSGNDADVLENDTDVSGNDADASEKDEDTSDDDSNNVLEMAVTRAAARVSSMLFSAGRAAEKVYTLDELGGHASGSYGVTESAATPTNVGALQISYSERYAQTSYNIPASLVGQVTEVTVNVASGTSTGTLALKLLTSSGDDISSSANSNGQLVEYGNMTISAHNESSVAVLGIMHTGNGAGEYVINSVTFKTNTGESTYKFTELTQFTAKGNYKHTDAFVGATKFSFTDIYKQANLNIPSECLSGLASVTVSVASGTSTGTLALKLLDSDGKNINPADSTANEIVEYGKTTISTHNESSVAVLGIMHTGSSAGEYTINTISFNMSDGTTKVYTPAQLTLQGIPNGGCTLSVPGAGTQLTYSQDWGMALYNIPSTYVGKVKKITLDLASGNANNLSFRLYTATDSSTPLNGQWGQDGVTATVPEDKKDQVARFGIVCKSQANGGFVVKSVTFELEADDSGDTPDPDPDPTPSDNQTWPVQNGNTGVKLPATDANMKSYYASKGVTHTDPVNGVQTVTYPSGYNQIQFTLAKSIDLTQYNQVTFTAMGATKPVKFGLHYWSDETGTINIWSSPSSQPTANGYYTFELNSDLFGDNTTATTISVWSDGDAQTYDFHGVTFENIPDKTFAKTREETFTADQLTTSSADAAKGNGAWTVNFSGQDQDVVFNLPESIDMSKCLGITLHITTVNGPVNLFISKDGNKLESYWNTHSANGVVADSSITATGAINQFGVQAGRDNDAFVPGTSITFTGITFLMSGPKLENPVVNNNTTTCSAGCFDFDNAEKSADVTVDAQMSADGKKVEAETVTFGQAGLNLTVEIPTAVDVNYLKSVAAQGQFPGVTVSLLNGDKNVIADADGSNIITLSKYFTGAKYIRFTSTTATTMTLTGVVFNTEVPIVLNGDFADADVNVWSSAAWSPSAVTAESAGSAIVGGVSTYGKITGRNSPYQCFAQDITARVTNGKIYKFSFWAKLSDDYKDAGAALREVAFSPYYKDANGKEQYGLVPGGRYKQSLTAGEWTYFEGTVKVPANSTGFVIRIMEQGTNYGQGDCIKGEYYVTGVKMWETDREDAGAGGGGGGGSYGGSNNRVPTKESKYEITYEVEDLEVSWASATTKTVATGTQVNFSNNYDEARFKLPRPLDMSLCAFLQVKTSGQNVPIAIKLYKNGSQVQVDYYNQIGDTYMFIPTFEGNIDAVGIMSLATPNPAGATVTVDSFTFGFTEELPPYVPPTDIVLNGDFADEDLSDWYAAYWDNVTITREIAKTPIYDDVRTYATYSRRTSPYQCFAQDITDRVEQGETYTFSFWAKLSNDYKDAPPEQRVVQFGPYTEDKNGVADYNPRLEGTYSQVLEPGVWTYFEGTYKVTNENPIGRVVIRILEQGTNYGQGDCVKGSYSIAGVKMEVYVPEPPSIDEDVPNLRDETTEDFGSDFLMGTAMGIGEVDDIGIEMLIRKHFNAVTIGNELKPDALFGYSNSEHTELKTITFNGQSLEVPTLNYNRAEELLDKILEWNEAQPDKPIKVRGHVLVWHAQTPEWFFREGYTVKQNADGTENYVTPEVMNLRLEWYIKTVLEHFTGEDSPYKDLFYGWDVVNEAVADTGVYRSNKVNSKEQPGDDTHSSNSSWWAVYQSNEFIINAFKYANKYAPADLELYYNDYNDSEPNKVKGISQLLSDVLAEEGTRIDAMGMQCHYTLGHPTLENMEKAIRTYAEIVGTVQLTEFDLKAAGNIESDSGLEREYKDQAVRYHEIYEMLKKLDAEDGIEIGGFTVWGTIDSHSWLQSASGVGGGADGTLSHCPLLFDSNYKVKPAYWALVDYSKVDPDWKEAGEELPEETESSQESEQPEEPSSEEELKTASVAAASPKSGNPIPIVVAVCVAVAAVGGGTAYVFLRKKKEGGGAGPKK